MGANSVLQLHHVLQGVVHGCPYKSWKPDSVAAALGRLRVEPLQIQAAVSKAKGGHFQLACAAAWEGAHGCECVTGINHPNQVWNDTSACVAACNALESA